MKRGAITSIVVVSDTHCGCQLGLCPPTVALDHGGTYNASRLQRVVWSWWREFCDDFVPDATKGEPFAVVHNGDCLDGVHHGSTTQITHNLADQRRIAVGVLRPLMQACGGRYYHIRGTEAHVGQSGEHEEAVARELGAIPDEEGNHARWEMRLRFGKHLLHFTHHIATTSSPYSETTALTREAVNMFVECGQSGDPMPSMIVRSHRHRYSAVRVPFPGKSERDDVHCVTTPAWQLKTPFVFKTGARNSQPQIGGLVIRLHEGELFYRRYVKRISPQREEVIA